MSYLLILLVAAFAIAAAVALVRGLMAFFADAEMIRRSGGVGQEAFGVKQNRMMFQRVLFQGIAIMLVVLIGAVASQS